MDQIDQARRAQSNFTTLSMNPYTGKGMVVGLDETGKNMVQAYWIMGRHANTRNRVFRRGERSGHVIVDVADPSRIRDPVPAPYDAMREGQRADRMTAAVVGSGNQTNKIISQYAAGRGLREGLSGCTYESDAPNFTALIAAASYWPLSSETLVVRMAIVRKSLWSDASDLNLYEINDTGRGFGYCLTTCSGNGNPVPAFVGEPYLLPLRGDARQIADLFWDALNVDNRVALAVKFIPKRGSSDTVIVGNFS